MNKFNWNGLRNLLTLIFGAGGFGLSAIFPTINPFVGAGIGLWVRAILDYFWPADGNKPDWVNATRNFLTFVCATGDVFHTYFMFIPPGLSVTLAIWARSLSDSFLTDKIFSNWPNNFKANWPNSLRNLLSGIFVSADALHSFLPFLKPGIGASLSLLVRSGMDQMWPAVPVTVAPVSALPADPGNSTSGGSNVKSLSWLVGFLLFAALATPGFCGWDVPRSNFVGPQKVGVSLDLPALGGVAGVLVPAVSLGSQIGTLNPAYGFSVDEAFILCNLVNTTTQTTHLSSILGVQGGLFVDAGPWINNNFNSPVQVKAEAGLIGPDLGAGLVEGVLATWDFNTGERKILVNANLNMDFANNLIKRIF